MIRWQQILAACLSPPIVIEPDEVFVHTLRVLAGTPDGNLDSRFDVEDPLGTYRTAWPQALSSFDAEVPGFGPSLRVELRASNAFTILTH